MNFVILYNGMINMALFTDHEMSHTLPTRLKHTYNSNAPYKHQPIKPLPFVEEDYLQPNSVTKTRTPHYMDLLLQRQSSSENTGKLRIQKGHCHGGLVVCSTHRIMDDSLESGHAPFPQYQITHLH